MEKNTYFLINNDISKIVNTSKVQPIQKMVQKKSVPTFQKLNEDVPYLTEEKIEDALMSDTPSSKTIKLLQWLTIKENLDIARDYYNSHQDKFEDCKYILESKHIDFNTLIKNLIKKHEQAISNGE